MLPRRLRFVIYLLIVCYSIKSGKCFDFGLDNDVDDQDGQNEDKMVLTAEESEIYDKDKDGTLNHKELAKYLQDILKRKKSQPVQENDLSRWSALNVAGLTLKEVGVALALCILTIVVFYWFQTIKKSQTQTQGVHVEDIRAARLRKLEQSENPQSVKSSRADFLSDSTKPASRSKTGSDAPSAQDTTTVSSSEDDSVDDFELTYKTSKKGCKTTKKFTGSTRTTENAAEDKSQKPNLVSSSKQPHEHDEADLTPQQRTTRRNTQRKTESSEDMPIITKDIPFEKVVEIILSKVLECKFVSSGQDTSIGVLNRDEIPGSMDKINMVPGIVMRRLRINPEPVKLSIKCYNRCLEFFDPSIKKLLDIWQEVTKIVKQNSVKVILDELVKVIASPTSIEDDLWTNLYYESSHEDLSLYFLNCLTGWSSDGVSVSSDLLRDIFDSGKDEQSTQTLFVNMIVLLGKYVKSLRRMDEIALKCSSLFKGVEVLANQPQMIEFISTEFLKEVQESSASLGSFFREKSLFSSFLSLTSLEAKVTGKSLPSQPFLSLLNFPDSLTTDIERVQSQLQDGFHSCQSVVYNILRKTLLKHPQSGLGWIAAIVADNDVRSKVLMSEDPDKAIECDGYMMNVCHVLLRLCEPFFVSKGEGKVADISPEYCLSDACRLKPDNERTLTGSCIESEDRDAKTNFILSDELKGKFVLKTEVFHITHRALHVGLTKTIQHYNRLLRHYLVLQERNEGRNQEFVQKVMTLFVVQWRSVIEDEEFMRLCSEFYLTNAFWLTKTLGNCEEVATKQGLSEDQLKEKQKSVMSAVPEFYVKDMCAWFSYVANNCPQVLRDLKIIYFVDCCAMIMSSKGFVPGPMVSSKIVEALYFFTGRNERNESEHSLLQRPSWGSGVEGCLRAAVVVSPDTRKKLASALIQTYSSVDVVEGLDVDKDDFDKFVTRSEVTKLLEFLWNYPECVEVVKKNCQVEGFLKSVLDSLLYLLNDGLSRLTNVSKLQKSIEDESKWDEMDANEKQQKVSFLQNEQRASKSFIRMANTTLSFLALITKEPEIAKLFCREPLSQRSASTIICFLDSLCGPRRLELKVKNMERYSFNPRDLLGKLASILCSIAGSDDVDGRFLRDMVTNPDFNKTVLEHAVKTVTRHDLVSTEDRAELESLIKRCELKEQIEHDLNQQEQDDIEPMPPKSEQNDAEVERLYEDQLKDERHGTCQLLEATAFQSFCSQPVNQRCSKIRALMREITQLKDSLPVHINSSIFVRQDEERMDFARTLITGPVDTPYSRGCFVFDVYFPSNYPNVPPLVKLITTGNGTVRFNPNLYADGKVCLSLLGTWHGGDASEKWNPKTSSLYQVLLSIQGMILIPDPVFNEPGYEDIRGTDDGDELSCKYNATIRLATIRHAMLAQIRNPPAGFEKIINTHFRLQKEHILRQVNDWLRQCQQHEEHRKMSRDIEELKVELNRL